MSFRGSEGTQKELEEEREGWYDVNSVLKYKILIKPRHGGTRLFSQHLEGSRSGSLRVCGQPGLHSKTGTKNKAKNKTKIVLGAMTYACNPNPIPALRRQRQNDQEFEAGLSSLVTQYKNKTKQQNAIA